MKIRRFLIVPIVLLLTACPMPPLQGSDMSKAGFCTGQDSPRDKIECQIIISVRNGVPAFQPEKLHVWNGPVTITWKFVGEPVYQFQHARRDGVFFKNGESDGGPFENGKPHVFNDRFTTRGADGFQWDDTNVLPPGSTMKEYGYQIFFRDSAGKTFFSPDPPIVNHGSH